MTRIRGAAYAAAFTLFTLFFWGAGVQTSAAYSSSEMGCLALNVYHEARGESLEGQLAVAVVTLNRVTSDRYPESVCEVVWQPAQFSWTRDRARYFPEDLDQWNEAMAVAKMAVNEDHHFRLGNVTHFHARHVKPGWSDTLDFVAQIGNHLFYSS